ncbi:MAG: site-specific integrase [Candidatus Peribacteria bacterium]|jgi:site-specific recombinase XerC|nr:site-specific integrase [Candidatus Peribacteria bacterium]
MGSTKGYGQDFNLLSTHLERFINYLQYTKNSSPKTIENYSLRVNRFISYVGDVSANQVHSLQIQDFRIFLVKQGLSHKTVNYHIV